MLIVDEGLIQTALDVLLILKNIGPNPFKRVRGLTAQRENWPLLEQVSSVNH